MTDNMTRFNSALNDLKLAIAEVPADTTDQMDACYLGTYVALMQDAIDRINPTHPAQ